MQGQTTDTWSLGASSVWNGAGVNNNGGRPHGGGSIFFHREQSLKNAQSKAAQKPLDTHSRSVLTHGIRLSPLALAVLAALAPSAQATTYLWDSTTTYPSGDPLTLNAGDSLSVDNILGYRELVGQTLTNNGVVNWNTTDSLYLNGGSVIANHSAFNLLAGMTLLENGGNNTSSPAAFNNYGTFNNASSAAVDVNSTQYFVFTNEANGVITTTAGSTTNFNGNGTTQLDDGSMLNGGGAVNINDGATFNGAFKVASGTTLELVGGTIVGAGSTQTPAGATLSGTLVWDQGTITGRWVNPSGSTWNAITSGNGKIMTAAAITNDGTVTWNSTDSLYFNSGSVIANHSTFKLLAGMTLLENGGNNTSSPAAFNNYGTFDNAGSAAVDVNSTQFFVFTNDANGVITTTAGGTTNFNGNGTTQFDNGSTFNGGGVVNINDGATFNGALRVASGTTLEFVGGTIAGAGSTQTPAGATLNGTLVWDQGTITGTWVNPAGSTWNAISSGSGKVMSGAALANHGTVNWSSNDALYFNSHSVINNTGTFDVSGSTTWLENSGNAGPPTADFNNNGGTVSTSGAGTLTVATTCCMAFNDKSGTINAAGGSINFSGANNFFTNTTFKGAGLVTVSGGGTFSQNVDSVPGASAAADALQLTGGTLTGNRAVIAAGSEVNWVQGTPTGTWTIASGGVLDATTSGSDKVMSGAAITNDGTVNWNSTDALYFNSGSVITNNATFNLLAGTTLLEDAGNNSSHPAQFVNNGLLQQTGTAANATTAITVTQYFQLVNSAAGTLSSNATGGSTLTLNGSGAFTNSGTLQVGSGDSLVVNTGAFTNFSESTLTGGTYSVSGTLKIDNLGSTGGEIVTDAANIILNGASSSFLDGGSNNALSNLATIAAAGSFGLLGGRNFTTAGNFTNNGTLSVGAGSTFAIPAADTLTNFSGTTLTGGTYDVTGTLKFHGANIVTNAANVALTGSAAEIENSSNSANALANFATNSATGSFSLLGGLNFTTAGNFTNNGTLSVGSGSTFAVASAGSLTNFSGTTLTGGTYDVTGTLKFAGANIVTDAAKITLGAPTAELENSTTSANALANLATIAAASSFTLAGGANFTTANTPFHNSGTLSVGAGSTFDVTDKLTNFSATTDTLTGGTYDVTGTLEDPGINIVTNAAKITLGGPAALIENSTTSGNGLANLATNASTGKFSLAGNANFTTVGNFSTAGTVSIAAGSTFTVGGPGVYTQTAGTTTDSGTLAAAGGVALNAGALFGGGTITGNLTSAGAVTITPGATAAKTGILTDTGTYTQNGGSLDILIAGTTAGTKFDALNATTANLGGTLNLTTKAGYTPTVGSTFKIVNFGTDNGTTFTTVTGTTINSTEEYAVTYQPTDVLLTVESTQAPAARNADALHIGSGSDRVEEGARLTAARSADTVRIGSDGVEEGARLTAARSADTFHIGSAGVEEGARLTAALSEFNAAYADGRERVNAPSAALSTHGERQRIRALELIKTHR